VPLSVRGLSFGLIACTNFSLCVQSGGLSCVFDALSDILTVTVGVMFGLSYWGIGALPATWFLVTNMRALSFTNIRTVWSSVAHLGVCEAFFRGITVQL
jgi:hypothetical protein